MLQVICIPVLSLCISAISLFAAARSAALSAGPALSRSPDVDALEWEALDLCVGMWLCSLWALARTHAFQTQRHQAWRLLRARFNLDAPVLTPCVSRKHNYLRMWQVIQHAREANRRHCAHQHYQARELHWFRGIRDWMHLEWASYLRSLGARPRAFLLLLYLLMRPAPLPTPQTAKPTQSQMAVDPFASPSSHSSHLWVHTEEWREEALARLRVFGPEVFVLAPIRECCPRA